MDSFNDLQQLWQETAPEPALSANELIGLVRKQRLKLLARLAGSVLALLLTLPVMIWVYVDYHPVYATTRLSIIMMIIAIVAGIFMQSRSLPLLLKPLKEDVDNQAMILALQKLRQKQKFIHTTFISWYFVVLGVAMAMYLFEFVHRNLWFAIGTYVLTFGWYAFAWVYLRPRNIRKQNERLDAMIKHLQQLQES